MAKDYLTQYGPNKRKAQAIKNRFFEVRKILIERIFVSNDQDKETDVVTKSKETEFLEKTQR